MAHQAGGAAQRLGRSGQGLPCVTWIRVRTELLDSEAAIH